MPRLSLVSLALLATLVAAAPAGAKAFTVSTAGNKPSIAVDASGAAHVVWDTVAADTSTTHYCKVPRAAAKCATGTEKTFAPAEGDQDFGGPRIFLTGGQGILIATARCCNSSEGPDGQFHSTRLFAFSSGDGGATFGPAAWIGTQAPDIGAAYSAGTVLTFGITGSGSGLQGAPVGGFSGTENTITSLLGTSGGIGVSPRGNLVGIGAGGNVLAGPLDGDANTSSVAFQQVAKGTDVVVTSGPKGADLFYKTNAKNARYVVRRYAGGKAGPVTATLATPTASRARPGGASARCSGCRARTGSSTWSSRPTARAAPRSLTTPTARRAGWAASRPARPAARPRPGGR
jgi:hypothetical protein